MLVEIPDVLTAAEVAEVRRIIEAADFVDGRVRAGEVAARAKHNLQLPQEGQAARDAGDIVLKALGRNPLLPARPCRSGCCRHCSTATIPA
jgi:PKHD-type hydroxylase